MKTTEQMIQEVERQATLPISGYNPIARVKCPHCGGTMEAMDAKLHVRIASEKRS